MLVEIKGPLKVSETHGQVGLVELLGPTGEHVEGTNFLLRSGMIGSVTLGTSPRHRAHLLFQ